MTAAAQPLPTLASAGDSLAAAAATALADLDDMPGLARSNRPANPAERRDAIAPAWRDEPGITRRRPHRAVRVGGRTIQRDLPDRVPGSPLLLGPRHWRRHRR
jgi:hypothetical protein